MENIYMMSDSVITKKIGERLKSERLRQNITQQNLAHSAQVSFSMVRRIEAGEIKSFDAFLRIVRTLGLLDILEPLTAEIQMSPNEYYEFVNSKKRQLRKRAVGKLNSNPDYKSPW